MSGGEPVDALLDAAIAHHQGGQAELAEAGYRAVLHLSPDDLDALNLLGLLLQERGQIQQSLALISHALSIDPDFSEALVNQARALRAAGDTAGAITAARKAVALEPALGEAHLQLGFALADAHDDAAGEAALVDAARLLPNSFDAVQQLGSVRLRMGHYQQALQAFQDAWTLTPGRIETMVNLGAALAGLEKPGDAIAWLDRAVVAAPDDPSVHIARAVTQRRAHDAEASAAACRRAIELAPERLDMWLLLGSNLATLGRFTEAEAQYRHVLSVQPDSAHASRELALIGRLATDAAEVANLRQVVGTPDAAPADRIAAGHALGALLDRAGHYDDAFAAIDLANGLTRDALRRDGRSYDNIGFRRYVNWVRAAFTRHTVEQAAVLGDPSDLPVFIVGMPRSGTSLVEQILASHPSVYGGGERRDIGQLVHTLGGGNLIADPLSWDPAAVQEVTAAHVARLRTVAGGAVRVTDKLPDNTTLLGHIAVLFPNARIIVCRRDPRDIGVSCLFSPFGERIAWTFDQVDLAMRAQEIDRLLAHWASVLPLRIIEVHYEALVANLEPESRRLIDFLDLEWDPACLAFHATERPVMTASYWQVRQALYNTSVGRWRHYRRHLGPLLVGLMGLVDVETEDEEAIAAGGDASVRAAVSVHLSGQIEAAEAAYQILLRHNPTDYRLLHLLGVLRADQGDGEDAVTLLRKATAAHPHFAPAYADLARAHLLVDQVTAATEAATQAIRLDSGYPGGHSQLGMALMVSGDYAAATVTLRRAVALDPQSISALSGLGCALLFQEAYAEALPVWADAAALAPDDVGVLVDYAECLSRSEMLAPALKAFERAFVLEPFNSRAATGLAATRLRLGDFEGTLKLCEQILASDPLIPAMLLTQGAALAASGRFGDAESSYRGALSVDPASAEALEGLSSIGAHIDDDLRAVMRGALQDETKPDADRVAAGFALGRDLDRAGQYDRAFAAYTDANKVLRHTLDQHAARFTRTDLQNYVDWLCKTFNADFFSNFAGFGVQSEQPVFIVGMPRSGTSLVEQIIASHPSAFGQGERRDIETILTMLNGDNIQRPPITWDRDAVGRAAAEYISSLTQRVGAAARVTDKMPDNIFLLGLIAVLFPSARIIFCQRDPRDIALSCYFQRFDQPGHSWASDVADCGFRIRLVNRLMAHWQQVLPLRIMTVQYETLVDDFGAEVRRIINFLDLPWDPACLAFHTADRQVVTASLWQVRQPLYSSAVGRWRHYRQHLEPLLRELAQI